MQHEVKTFLRHIQRASELILEFAAERDFADYEQDAMLRSAIERQFSIIGEALRSIAVVEPAVAARITDYREIVGFRNILVHSYATVDDRLVWDAVSAPLALLQREVAALLAED